LADKHPQRERLDRDAAGLFFSHAWRWYGRPSEPAGWRAASQELFRQYDRGMLCELRVSGQLAHLAGELPGLFAAEPVGTIVFQDVRVRAGQLRAVRRLAVPPRPVRLAFRRLTSGGSRFGFLGAVVNSMLATAAVGIDATGHPLAANVLGELTRSPFLTNLRELILDATRPEAVGADLLLGSPRFAGLHRLSLRKAVVPPDRLIALRDRFAWRLVV
jgi:hypothetical protein